jgi:hypothetical protein
LKNSHSPIEIFPFAPPTVDDSGRPKISGKSMWKRRGAGYGPHGFFVISKTITKSNYLTLTNWANIEVFLIRPSGSLLEEEGAGWTTRFLFYIKNNNEIKLFNPNQHGLKVDKY